MCKSDVANTTYSCALIHCRQPKRHLLHVVSLKKLIPFTAELETLVAKDNNGVYYVRLVVASRAAVTVYSSFVGFI